MSAEFPDPHIRCPHCNEMIDPDTCWCGQPENEHGYYDSHMFVPMGCDCYRDKGEKWDVRIKSSN
jgi:hypothetical protein